MHAHAHAAPLIIPKCKTEVTSALHSVVQVTLNFLARAVPSVLVDARQSWLAAGWTVVRLAAALVPNVVRARC